MNILSLLSKEKKVAGIEISDSVVRIAFFSSLKTDSKKASTDETQNDELILIEEPIGANIIVNGEVVDVELLGKTLKNIWSKAKLGTDYAIVAIPDDKIYSRIFSFPKSVDGARLSEAMRLAIGFQLPMNTEDSYLDWERVSGNQSLNEILLSMTSQEVVKKYVAALEISGIKTLALESNLASIARAIKLTPNEITIFSKTTPDGATIFALENGLLRFSRTLPSQFVSEDKVSSEANKVKISLETTFHKPVRVEEFSHAQINDMYAKSGQFGEQKSKWLIALGAAIRGKIPEGTDNLVSLLPIGTEEAYAYQKATIFITLLRNITVGVSVFFVVAFLLAYLFVFSLSQTTTRAMTILSSTPVSPELLENETMINKVNELTSAVSTILAETPTWSIVLEKLAGIVPDGITVSSFSAPSITGKFSMNGTARDRVTLNDFKKTLQQTTLFTEIELPIANLEQERDIPFSISFRISDLGAVYYK